MPSSPQKKRKEFQPNISHQPPSKKLKETHASDGEFQVVKASLVVSVPPVFAANPRAGVDEMLDSMIMRYISSLQGVVLSHSNLAFMNKAAVIQRDCPFLVCKVAFDATVWSPRVGCKLSGKVNLCSPDHISLLVHRTFNVSIPRQHIPTDTWEFEYGPAENDPDFGAIVHQEEETAENEKGDDHATGGKWVHKVTGETLGGQTGFLEFTVIGLTVANEMLSLLGSLQPDPFSSRYTIHHPTKSPKEAYESSGTEDNDDSDAASESDSSPELEKQDEESDSDTFQSLGKRKDLAQVKREKPSIKKRKQG
ncbi:hypothetical protein BDZ97DRAFT_1780820 [Flammula alnicola]|nr:hypothetical protein BDZ97DRAFT_1780820 [Flammula alnicola]